MYKQDLYGWRKRTAQMLKLRTKGWTLQQIGTRYGITRNRVHQIIGKTKRGVQ